MDTTNQKLLLLTATFDLVYFIAIFSIVKTINIFSFSLPVAIIGIFTYGSKNKYMVLLLLGVCLLDSLLYILYFIGIPIQTKHDPLTTVFMLIIASIKTVKIHTAFNVYYTNLQEQLDDSI